MAKGRKVRASRAAQGYVEFSHFPPAVHFDLIRKQAVVINRSGLRSEERFSRNAETDLVCRLLFEKKNRRDVLRDFAAPSSATRRGNALSLHMNTLFIHL